MADYQHLIIRQAALAMLLTFCALHLARAHSLSAAGTDFAGCRFAFEPCA
jgi:hypothetical protein